MSNRESDKKNALLARKQQILREIKYYEKRIENATTSKSCFYDDDSSDSELEFQLDIGPSMTELKLREKMLRTCLHATEELTSLIILQSEVNVMVESPVFDREPLVTEEGDWREVMAECRVDLVSFSITFCVHKSNRLFGPTSYRNLKVTLAKVAHEKELAKSVLADLTLPSDAVEVLRNYAVAHRSRRSTLARLAERFADSLFMEPMADGGYLLKCANLLEVSWTLQNKWSQIAPFHHRMTFDLEYMDEAYIKIITQAHRQLLDPNVETNDRTLLMAKIITTCLEAEGPTQELYESMESDSDSRKLKTTLDQEPDVPVMKMNKDSEVMAPPKTLPKKTKPKGKENTVDNQSKSLKRALETDADNPKRSKVDSDVIVANSKNDEAANIATKAKAQIKDKAVLMDDDNGMKYIDSQSTKKLKSDNQQQKDRNDKKNIVTNNAATSQSKNKQKKDKEAGSKSTITSKIDNNQNAENVTNQPKLNKELVESQTKTSQQKKDKGNPQPTNKLRTDNKSNKQQDPKDAKSVKSKKDTGTQLDKLKISSQQKKDKENIRSKKDIATDIPKKLTSDSAQKIDRLVKKDIETNLKSSEEVKSVNQRGKDSEKQASKGKKDSETVLKSSEKVNSDNQQRKEKPTSEGNKDTEPKDMTNEVKTSNKEKSAQKKDRLVKKDIETNLKSSEEVKSVNQQEKDSEKLAVKGKKDNKTDLKSSVKVNSDNKQRKEKPTSEGNKDTEPKDMTNEVKTSNKEKNANIKPKSKEVGIPKNLTKPTENQSKSSNQENINANKIIKNKKINQDNEKNPKLSENTKKTQNFLKNTVNSDKINNPKDIAANSQQSKVNSTKLLKNTNNIRKSLGMMNKVTNKLIITKNKAIATKIPRRRSGASENLHKKHPLRISPRKPHTKILVQDISKTSSQRSLQKPVTNIPRLLKPSSKSKT